MTPIADRLREMTPLAKHMVERFLSWRLPENFNPDAGISFKKFYNEHMPFGPQKHEPVGTNLFDAEQARQMVEYMLVDLSASIVEAARKEAESFYAKDAVFDKAAFVDGARFGAAFFHDSQSSALASKDAEIASWADRCATALGLSKAAREEASTLRKRIAALEEALRIAQGAIDANSGNLQAVSRGKARALLTPETRRNK